MNISFAKILRKIVLVFVLLFIIGSFTAYGAGTAKDKYVDLKAKQDQYEKDKQDAQDLADEIKKTPYEGDKQALFAEYKAEQDALAKLQAEVQKAQADYDASLKDGEVSKPEVDQAEKDFVDAMKKVDDVTAETNKLRNDAYDQFAKDKDDIKKAATAKADLDKKLDEYDKMVADAQKDADEKEKLFTDLGKSYDSKQPDQANQDQRRDTLLPETAFKNISDCETIGRYVNAHVLEVREMLSSRTDYLAIPNVADDVYSQDVLGCAIKTGDIKLWMLPYYIRYMLEFVIGLAGLIAVGGLVYGGYLYLFAGLLEDKEKGKNAIKNAIIGLVLSLTAWSLVNILISLVTG
ncbi:hypothetical protein HZC20_02720 [Candidatus Peregrinibacteria bacterium]|nr:hypothetical protein [Candidatus Peregrinibacteria bacterium]